MAAASSGVAYADRECGGGCGGGLLRFRTDKESRWPIGVTERFSELRRAPIGRLDLPRDVAEP